MSKVTMECDFSPLVGALFSLFFFFFLSLSPSPLFFWLSGKGEDKDLPLAWSHDDVTRDCAISCLLLLSPSLSPTPPMDIRFSEVWNYLS